MDKVLFKKPKKARKQSGLTAGKIAFLAFLALLFIFLLATWVFLNVYSPPISDMPDISDFFRELDFGAFTDDDIEDNGYDGVAAAEIIRGDRRQGDSYTFLIMGMDHDTLIDTIMFVHFNVKDNKINFLSIPRDSWINITWGGGSYRGRINRAFADGFVASRRAGRTSAEATEAGIANMRQIIKRSFGLPVDFYIFMNLAGFRALVDAVGGVELYVPRNMVYSDPYQNPPLHINLTRGLQTLNGRQAEHFVRFRYGYADGDLGRIRAQQTFMAALARQMLRFDLGNIEAIFRVATDHITTNLSMTNLTWFAVRALNVRLEDITTHTLPGESARVGAASVLSLYRAESMQMINEHYNPFLTDIPDSNFNIFEISRNNVRHANLNGVTMAELLGNR